APCDATALPLGTPCDPRPRAVRAGPLLQRPRAACTRDRVPRDIHPDDSLDPLPLDPLEREVVRANGSAGDRALGSVQPESSRPATRSHPGREPGAPLPALDDPGLWRVAPRIRRRACRRAN